ncbi:EcsC family protein [Aeromonas sp. 600584]|uniref:EcsC family protein n=1 Tax=Aeromonas sp. 600584 TaxID=2712030 RepID=UPI003BA229E2
MLSDYERSALLQIHAWKNPQPTFFDKALSYVNTPLEFVGKYIPVPFEQTSAAFVDACTKSMNGIVNLVNDGSQWSVRPNAIFEELSEVSKQKISSIEQIALLDLHLIDKSIGWLDTKYEGIALVEGAVAGGASVINPLVALATIPTDLVALTALNLRAIGEYGTYCGFDMTSQEERLFALNVLALASSYSDRSKQVALAHLVKIAKDVAMKKTWEQLNEHLFVRAVQSIAESLSINLTKAKLANFIPAAGAVMSGGFNAYYTDKVCKSAFYLYRERFLALKYGPDIIEVTVQPAKSDEWGADEVTC